MNKILFFFFVLVLGCNRIHLSQMPVRVPASYLNNCMLLVEGFLESPTPFDSAVELELDATDKVLNLLTTTDGKIRGLLGIYDPPPWFEKWAEKKFPGMDPLQIEWDSLSVEQKHALLVYQSSVRQPSFFQSRRIFGLKVRDHVELKFQKQTVFLGKTYEKGRHTVDVSHVFHQVEYMSPESVKNVSGFELHFRINRSSGEVSRDAWTFLEAVGIEKPHQHIHIVAQVPLRELEENPREYPLMMSDFFRRVNLASEFLTLVADGGFLNITESKGIVYFNVLEPDNLRGVHQYFQERSIGKNPIIGDNFKMGWVGMRGSDKYDQDNLWGLEYRAIGTHNDPDVVQGILNVIQLRMTEKKWGISLERARHWISHMGNPDDDDIPDLVGRLLYHQPLNQVLDEAPLDLKVTARTFEMMKNITQNDRKHFEVKMLFFDWSRDPLLYDNKALLDQIRNAQMTAIDELNSIFDSGSQLSYGTINRIVSHFLETSGLFEKVLDSIGIRPSTKPKQKSWFKKFFR